MDSNKKSDYKSKILNKLDKFPSGLTITDLSNETDIHRNTVSKYLSNLEVEGLVSKKEIGAAHLYFSKKREYLRKDLVNNFLKALIYALKKEFPKKNENFKEIGKQILKRFRFPIGEAYIEEFKKARSITDPIAQLKLFQKFYNSYDFFQDDLNISIQKLTSNKITYRLAQSEYLENSSDYIYFFYIACGIIEEIYRQNLNRVVNCDIDKVSLSKNKEDSYLEISIQILK